MKERNIYYRSMRNYIKLMRPKHYIKNILLFLPLVFSGRLFDFGLIGKSLLAFMSFSILASIVYILNDIQDREKDAMHPKKKERPIASGKIKVKNAYIFVAILSIFVLLLNYLACGSFINISLIFLGIYLVLNVFYSLGLKNIPLVDISILVSGFLLRVMYGASVLNIEISNWLYLTIMAASFYLGLGKRRNEMMKVKADTRKVLKFYTQEFLDKNMYMCLTLAIVFYSLWCIDPINVTKSANSFLFTIPLVMIILMKYSLNIEKDSYGDPVDVVLSDKILIVLILLYGLAVFSILYLI